MGDLVVLGLLGVRLLLLRHHRLLILSRLGRCAGVRGLLMVLLLSRAARGLVNLDDAGGRSLGIQVRPVGGHSPTAGRTDGEDDAEENAET